MSHDRVEPLIFHRTAPPEISRRHAMGLMAASLALATGACTRPPRERIYPWVDMPEARAGGSHLYYASACLRDGYAQGVRVATVDGRPVKVEGNPLHPASLGATDVFAQASVLQLWDPDRSTAVMQRIEGSASAATSSWQAFETRWRTEAAALSGRRGEGLRILTGPITSPTLRAQLADLLRQFPSARWHQHLPLRDVSAEAGAIAAFGRPVHQVLHFDRADCIVALGSDPFSDGPAAVRQAADWSRHRHADATRLFAVEATPGLFGARADRRLARAPVEIEAMLGRIWASLANQGAEPAPDAATRQFEAELIGTLKASGPASLIVPGACLTPASHALVHAIHARLGASGRTVDGLAPLDVTPDAGTLTELLDAMNAGAVRALVILDSNPVYDAPGALDFSGALAKVPFSAHAGLYRDETARAVGWHLPLPHAFEQWSDALAFEGTATLLQPAIAPLYDTRSAHELIALLAGDGLRDGHALVQRGWRERAGRDFDAFWRESLRRGVIEDSAPLPLTLRPITPATVPTAPESSGLVALFAPDSSVHDGQFANNAWLQEMPQPFTKLTWDNAVLIGRVTAQHLGLVTGDMVRATVDQRHLDAPVWVLDAQAEGVVTLPLGYGRSAAGRVGTGVGFNAYALRPALTTAIAPIQLERMAGRYAFAATQHTMNQAGRELARTVPAGGRIADPQIKHGSLYASPAPGQHAWAMTIDLDACIGCNACTIACQAENNIPVVGKAEVAHGREMHWIRVDRYQTPEVEGSLFQPVPCMHCENAPCELVCPVGATMHDTEGLNVQVYNRCIGTRFCSNNCPYKVRRFNFLQYTDNLTESLKAQRNPEVTVRRRGVMEKCSYCLQRIARARQNAQVSGEPLRDGDVVTACQAACPTRAIVFGDLADPASAVAGTRQSPRHYALLGELNTRPRTTYLARVTRRGGGTPSS